MVASLEYSKIQNLICNNSHRIMTDIYNSVHMKYNNKHNISQDYGQSLYVALYSRFTWQCNCFLCITYYIKKCYSSSATLASMNFFKRSGTNNLYSVRRFGYKNDVKTAKIYWNTCFLMQASDCVIIYLNKNKFSVALSTICDTLCTLTSKNAIFIVWAK